VAVVNLGHVMTSDATQLVLVNLGTPREPTPAAVRAFLDEFLSDPAVVDWPRWIWQPVLRGIVLRKRPARVAELYESIWGADGSPLRVETEAIVAGVRDRSGGRFHVSAAYRYGEPSLDTVMRRLAGERTGPVIVCPLFPQRTDATTGTALRRAREAAARSGIADRLVERLMRPDDPGYVRAMAAQWQRALREAGHTVEHIVVSFHGIPVRYDRREGGLYVRDCEATTRAFLEAIDWPRERATLAYQSKFGPEPWLKPATAGLLEQLPRRGVRSVAVITPGFLTDGLETIEEIGIRGRESFLKAGGEHFIRVGAVAAEPAFLDAVAALAAH
jgi:ferrochelatase